MFASLELLPMWSGVDPDVELYASGQVVDDDGDFSGGQALDDGETAGVRPWMRPWASAVTEPLELHCCSPPSDQQG